MTYRKQYFYNDQRYLRKGEVPSDGMPIAPDDGHQYGGEGDRWTQILNSVIQGRWLWDDATSGDPGLGNMGSNSGQLAGATELRFSATTYNGNPIPPDALYQPGDVIYVIDEDRVAYGRYTVVATTDNATWTSFTVLAEVSVGNPQTGNLMDVAYIPQAGVGGDGEYIAWETIVRTAPFTGVPGVGYFVNGANMTLPTGVPGNQITVRAVINDSSIFTTGQNIEGVGAAQVIVSGSSPTTRCISLFYIDATSGWVNVHDAGELVILA